MSLLKGLQECEDLRIREVPLGCELLKILVETFPFNMKCMGFQNGFHHLPDRADACMLIASSDFNSSGFATWSTLAWMSSNFF